MKPLPVFFSKEAGKDLDEVHDYILKISSSVAIAGRYVERLVSFCSRIGDVPNGGYPFRKLGMGYRGRIFENGYLVVYRVQDDKLVAIERIISCRRNVKRYRR